MELVGCNSATRHGQVRDSGGTRTMPQQHGRGHRHTSTGWIESFCSTAPAFKSGGRSCTGEGSRGAASRCADFAGETPPGDLVAALGFHFLF
jgi:hypothetical protein